jgi:hypothetical protein
MQIINQYSIVWSSLIVLFLVGFFTFRKGFNPQRILVVAGTCIVLLASWFILRPDPASTEDLSQLRNEIGAGQSVLLELQSPY